MKSAMSSSELLNRQLLFLFDTKTPVHSVQSGSSFSAAPDINKIKFIKSIYLSLRTLVIYGGDHTENLRLPSHQPQPFPLLTPPLAQPRRQRARPAPTQVQIRHNKSAFVYTTPLVRINKHSCTYMKSRSRG